MKYCWNLKFNRGCFIPELCMQYTSTSTQNHTFEPSDSLFKACHLQQMRLLDVMAFLVFSPTCQIRTESPYVKPSKRAILNLWIWELGKMGWYYSQEVLVGCSMRHHISVDGMTLGVVVWCRRSTWRERIGHTCWHMATCETVMGSGARSHSILVPA